MSMVRWRLAKNQSATQPPRQLQAAGDQTPSSNLRGIVAMLIAVIAFAVMDATLKQLGQSYAPIQVTSLRGWASVPFLIAVVTWTRSWRELRPVRWELHLARGLLSVGMLCLFIYSMRTLSLSSAYAIVLCGPLLITALSVPILKETVDKQRWLAIAIGLGGVFVMVRPASGDMLKLGALAAFAAALCYALASVLIKLVARTESTLSMSFSFVLIIAIAATILAQPVWTTVQPQHWLLIALLGLSGAIGQYFMVEAYRSSPASVVAPFDYTALIWGGLIDWLVWQTLPDVGMMMGGSIVVATGLYLIYRERVVAGRIVKAAGH
jgi:drug/metabolite transporter (DMT)-like permease